MNITYRYFQGILVLILSLLTIACNQKPVPGNIVTIEEVRELFADPPSEYRSAPLWDWNEQITEEEFLDFCKKVNSKTIFSPKETAAFSDWGKEQIKGARKHYHTSKKLWLKDVKKVKMKSYEEL